MKRSSLLQMASILCAVGFAVSVANEANAQETYDGAPWRFGVFGGMNFNIVGTGSQELQGIGTNFSAANTTTGTNDIIDGTGLGLYGGGLVEYNSGKLLGAKLRVGLDDRRVRFNDWDVPDATSTRFSARMTYVSVEPSLRLNLGSPDFHMIAGPLLSFKVATKYDYVPGRDETTPAVADQEIPNTNSFTYGVSGGFGYDININSKSTSGTKWYLTPFVEASYMMDQRDNTRPADRNDTWVTTSIRGGFEIKGGAAPAAAVAPPVVAAAPDMNAQVRVPPSVVEARRVIEFFPLRNYVFFDQGATRIPTKYAQLDAATASTFDAATMTMAPSTGTSASTTRAQRQMAVYYNLMNVVGDRMRDNSTSTIRLVGSAPDKSEALAMANSVRDYLVSTYGIAASRISTEGQIRAPHASGTSATPEEDRGLVAEENRRVEILSNDLALLKPVRLETMQQESFDNDIVMSVSSSAPLSNWTARISGEGFNQTYGPYSSNIQRVDAKEVLQSRSTGNYTAEITMIGADGKSVVRSTNFQLVKKDLPQATGDRFSILFEFDESAGTAVYDQFLRNEVAPLIPANATVVVHGHTDNVGTTEHNYDLSTRRATEAQRILQDELQKQGRSVTFDAYGFGEDESRAAFANTTPEGRYHNRTVMIEVVPAQ
jgi:outer membrane protein OmpA-like peptidoglycan-associated protein